MSRRKERGCVFCEIVGLQSFANVVQSWPDALAFVPLNPVTPGHVLVVPREHVADVTEDPEVSALTMRRAAELAEPSCNVITSAGAAATQTVFHLHVHIVPRREGDGLHLPWTCPIPPEQIHAPSQNPSGPLPLAAPIPPAADQGGADA